MSAYKYYIGTSEFTRPQVEQPRSSQLTHTATKDNTHTSTRTLMETEREKC